MSAMAGPAFDESFASVARELHVWEVTLASFAGAALLFWWLERRGRHRWAEVPAGHFAASRAPYRSNRVVGHHHERAPWLVRTASFASLAFGHLFTPLILIALMKYPFDGIAIPLLPGLGMVLLNWSCAWLLLSRSPNALAAARSGAVGSLIANVGLLVLAGAHLVTVELQRRDGIEHACSSSVTFVVIVYSVASIVQSLVTIAALRSHGGALRWSPAR
jgi:hypothetical protein